MHCLNVLARVLILLSTGAFKGKTVITVTIKIKGKVNIKELQREIMQFTTILKGQ